MVYRVGDKILARKPHACGGSEWIITRTGADVKMKCLKCGKSLFFSADKVKNMAKVHTGVGESNV